MQTDDLKKQAERRINVIKGQLDGLYRMIAADEYCTNVLDQSLSIQNSLKGLDAVILEKHLRIHVAKQFQTDKETAVKELLKVFKKKRRNDS